MAKAKKAPKDAGPKPPGDDPRISFYPAWCKHCGNCVAFCPRNALARDEWGAPYLARPERCTACGLCEMLCPDFAITVGEHAAPDIAAQAARGQKAAHPEEPIKGSPERLAPGPRPEDE